MQHTELLHTILKKSGAIKHKGRLKSVMTAVESVMNGANLDLTSLGRKMNKKIQAKSKIKEIDYLLSNSYIYKERLFIYKAINEWVIGDEQRLFIAIDWSSIVPHEFHLLRASLIRKGRAVTVYEEIFPESELGTGEAHTAFLRRLKLALPTGREVCIISDAGFRTDFFVHVTLEDWDYLGRILSNMHYTLQAEIQEKEKWQPTSSLYEQATARPELIGKVKLAKSNKIESLLYLYQRMEQDAPKNKVTVRKIKHGKKEKEHKNAAKKPWLIASSLELPAKNIIKIYSKRMKIEHDFRDSKDPKWGLGIRASRTVDPARLQIQLLIGFLAAILLWLIGLCLENKKLHYHFQANSIKNERVLSVIFLALEAIQSGYMEYVAQADFENIKKNGLYDEELNCINFVGIS